MPATCMTKATELEPLHDGQSSAGATYEQRGDQQNRSQEEDWRARSKSVPGSTGLLQVSNYFHEDAKRAHTPKPAHTLPIYRRRVGILFVAL
jgi:hypothetical protein